MKIKNIMLFASIFVTATLMCAERPGKGHKKNPKVVRDMFSDSEDEEAMSTPQKLASYEMELIDAMRNYIDTLERLQAKSQYLKNEISSADDKERLQKLNGNIKDALDSVKRKFKHANK